MDISPLSLDTSTTDDVDADVSTPKSAGLGNCLWDTWEYLKNTFSTSSENPKVRKEFVEILERREEPSDYVTLKVKRPENWDFLPGQYLHVRSDKKRSKLKFPAILAIASGVNDDFIEITGHPDHFGLHPNHCLGLTPGNALRIKGPKGTHFPLDKVTEDTPVWMIGGGSGITPLRSLQRSLAETTATRLIYSAKCADQLPYREELDLLAQSHQNVISLTQEDRKDFAKGRVTEHLADVDLPENALYFICGPKPLVTGTVQLLRARGVPPERIYASLPAFATQGGPVFRGDSDKFN